MTFQTAGSFALLLYTRALLSEELFFLTGWFISLFVFLQTECMGLWNASLLCSWLYPVFADCTGSWACSSRRIWKIHLHLFGMRWETWRLPCNAQVWSTEQDLRTILSTCQEPLPCSAEQNTQRISPLRAAQNSRAQNMQRGADTCLWVAFTPHPQTPKHISLSVLPLSSPKRPLIFAGLSENLPGRKFPLMDTCFLLFLPEQDSFGYTFPLPVLLQATVYLICRLKLIVL